MRQYVVILLISAILSLFNTSCKKNPTEPDIPEPGRRDYTWTVDTLDPGLGNISLTERIYGELPSEIWALGSGTGTSGLWHYNGKKWETEEKSGFYDIDNILGFSKNDMWICGSNSFWHYNGQQWERYENVLLPGYNHVSYVAMAGTGSDNLYAAGVTFVKDGITPKSAVAHFNGSEWKVMNILNIPVVIFSDIKLEKSTGKYFILSYERNNTSQLYRVFLLQGNLLKEILSSNKTITINSIKDECYFAAGEKIYKYRDDRMQLWKDFSGTNYLGFLWGRSESDIFTLNYDALGHYNGRDMIDIFKTNLWIRSGLLFENEVFFVCLHPETHLSYIIHGKLK